MRIRSRSISAVLLIAVFIAGSAHLVPKNPLLTSASAATSVLGDLTPFRTVATDVLYLVKAGNLAAAKIRIKDLETSWDEAEPSLKPRNAAQWHVLDKAIDRALSALRAGHPEQATSQKALEKILGLMGSAS